MGAYVFRSAPNNGHRATTAACPKSANRRLMQRSKITASFDHFI
jgi:hypothetical protein